jgi:NodT family efflux transporter outer membrane factor (OMF) lipoprotein
MAMSSWPFRVHSLPPAAGLALLAGCTVGPDYHPPAVAVPAQFERGDAEAAASADLAQWWQGWDDPLLNALVARGVAANLDLGQAAARVRQARWQITIAGASGRPQLSVQAEPSYTRLSRNSQIGAIASQGGGLAGAGLPGTDFDSYRAGFDASWEIDLFGGVRRSVEAARARADASEWSRRDARILIVSEIADGYFHLRSLDARIAIADADLAAQHELLDFISTRLHAGLVSTLDARRQEQAIAAATAARATLAAERETQLHALGLLLGGMPADLASALAASPTPPAVRPTIIAGLPSDLLRRRPDIRAAERMLAAASADIGVAVADRFPKLTLTGTAELVSTALASLFTGDSLQLMGAANLSLPLLDGGRARATVHLREDAYREAELAYRATVLAALRDVEDALSRHAADRDRLTALAAADVAARDALDTARVKYRAGLIDFLDVRTAEATSLDAADSLAKARVAVDQDMVALYKSLGGGWSESDGAREGQP